MALPTRPLGRTGFSVSPLGFGCMRLPVVNGAASDIDVPQAAAMLAAAVDAGVNYVDTAYPYHGRDRVNPGASEAFVGDALRGGRREKVILATKLPLWLVESRADMDRILDGQLARLRTPWLDVYLAHNVNSANWPRVRDLGLLDFFDAALKDGRIRRAGFSFHDRYGLFAEVLDSYDWHIAQIQYNYLDTGYQAGERGLRLAAAKGLGVVVMEPLRGGFLVDHLPEALAALLRGTRPEWSLVDWGLRWLWRQPEVGIALSGMSAMAHVEENLRIAGAAADAAGEFGERELEAVAAVRRYFQERLQTPCTACGYCLPCPHGVAIPKALAHWNDFHMVDRPELHARARFLYKLQVGEDERASRCAACRACEAACPQHIPIADCLPRVAAALEV